MESVAVGNHYHGGEIVKDSKVMTTTKLELDKSRRKLTFADCEPGEEIEAALLEAAVADSNYDGMTVGMEE